MISKLAAIAFFSIFTLTGCGLKNVTPRQAATVSLPLPISAEDQAKAIADTCAVIGATVNALAGIKATVGISVTDNDYVLAMREYTDPVCTKDPLPTSLSGAAFASFIAADSGLEAKAAALKAAKP